MRCQVCFKEVFTNDNLCDDCKKDLPFIKKGHYCKHCGRVTKIDGEYCDVCKNKLTAIDVGRSIFSYDGHGSRLVTLYKFHGRRYLKKFFAEEMYKIYIEDGIRDYSPNLIVYVPMTKKAERKRGFNQSLWLAEEFSKLTRIPISHSIVKVKETAHQVGLNRKERLENLQGAFHLKSKKEFFGKTVIIVDDVTTTGATAEMVAEKLKSAGAKRVILMTIASVGYIKNEGDK